MLLRPYLCVLLWWSSVVVAADDLEFGELTEYPNLGNPFLYTEEPVTPLPQGSPWGNRGELTKRDNGYPGSTPNTGVIRRYYFTISRKFIAPDGYRKTSLLINGQFPGPLIEANWGDTIQVTVKNAITGPEEATAIHWHGLLQQNTPWMDGVPSVTQCPIAPGKTFTYTFIADTYGTTWYHSHFSAQYADGAFGPLIIHGPKTSPYDVDLGPVLLTDYYHRNYTDINRAIFNADFNIVAVPAVNTLINGRNNFNCSLKAAGDNTPCVSNAGLAKFKFQKGKKHRLRIVNAGASAFQTFSIDNHNLTVIANDFIPIVPYQAQFVKLGVGQRADVIVETKNSDTPFFLRTQSPDRPCANTNQPNASAIGYFDNPNVTPTPNPWPSFQASVQTCENDPLEKTVPLYAATLPGPPSVTAALNITLQQNETGSFLFRFNGSAFRGNYNNPILLLSNLGNNSYPNDPQWNVHNYGGNTSIRLVVYNHQERSHPMHLHGHNYFVEKIGYNNPGALWDGSIVRPNNPQRRDTQIIPAFGYMVISFVADNPGAWVFHCHVAWHVGTGLSMTVLERPDLIRNYNVPNTVAQTCRDWWAYTNSTVVDQIDSGL